MSQKLGKEIFKTKAVTNTVTNQINLVTKDRKSGSNGSGNMVSDTGDLGKNHFLWNALHQQRKEARGEAIVKE